MERERLTITIKKTLLEQVDELIDGRQIRNRSHAIEYLVASALPSTVKKALILAGGRGIKMRPFTYEMPKPMIPVKGRPILEHIIELLRENDIREIIILIGPLGEKVRAYFGDGSKFGVKISYIKEKKPSGTAGPLRKAAPYFRNEPFFVIYGDVLADIDLCEMIKFHENSKTFATIALTFTKKSENWGIAKLNGINIIDYYEKPHTEKSSKLINAGIFIFEPNVIPLVPVKEIASIEKSLIPQLIKNHSLSGYIFEGKWFDIADPKTYEEALKNWK